MITVKQKLKTEYTKHLRMRKADYLITTISLFYIPVYKDYKLLKTY